MPERGEAEMTVKELQNELMHLLEQELVYEDSEVTMQTASGYTAMTSAGRLKVHERADSEAHRWVLVLRS